MTAPNENTAAVLTAARAIISDPAMWYQGDWTASGMRLGDEPCCASCAIIRAALAFRIPYLGIPSLMRQHTPANQSIDIFNDRDTTTHADILAVFDRAIAAAKVQS